MRLLCLGILMMGCQPDDVADQAPPPDPGPTPAPLAELSDGDCPSMAESGISTFQSGGIERKVSIVLPDGRPEKAPVIFTFHGLVDSGYDPVPQMVSGFQLQQAANELGAIIVTPEAMPTTLPGIGSFLLWGILDDAEADLTLFDDLRTCLSDELAIDLTRISAWGHSGGALWTTVLLSNRSDSLSTVLEFSGGADITIPLLGGPFVQYKKPEWSIPVFAASGGPSDVWPDPGFVLVDFEAATDVLGEGLTSDGHDVVRCHHTLGHYEIPADGWDYAKEWLVGHTFGQPSGVLDGSISAPPSWCALPE